MFTKVALSTALVAGLALAPMTQASAHDGYYRHHGAGPLGLLAVPFIAAGAVVGAAAAIATAPFAAAGPPPPVYAAPAYAAPVYAAPGYAYPYPYGYAYPYGYYRRR